MEFTLITLSLALATSVTATMSWSLDRVANPTEDESDAYNRITDAMNAAIARWQPYWLANKHCTVSYVPGIGTADGNYNGNIRFGSDRQYMVEGYALHEIAHVLGVGGGNPRFYANCQNHEWPLASMVIAKYYGQGQVLHCAGEHFYPYGLNFADEFSEENYARHCEVVDAMIRDGMQEQRGE
ncbi:unnamed protein product [Zymoseptoria tritici ST99CH_3D1]|uniref:Uncharacterized protein n=2 Tax=Zymoseptoria tritici TaxID=1047171 RepID=A0A1X7RSF7_ZYMT9|nr:unnamed protein product [Zymoseptoria tritici ST99CH_3D7]SMR51371.1 unnamed protein product [Zymoseptoria tritici ST99CH_1E4]SMR52559.1 unnamed protein product [Zymoseptoria tritici ST99CH_3D1]